MNPALGMLHKVVFSGEYTRVGYRIQEGQRIVGTTGIPRILHANAELFPVIVPTRPKLTNSDTIRRILDNCRITRTEWHRSPDVNSYYRMSY